MNMKKWLLGIGALVAVISFLVWFIPHLIPVPISVPFDIRGLPSGDYYGYAYDRIPIASSGEWDEYVTTERGVGMSFEFWKGGKVYFKASAVLGRCYLWNWYYPFRVVTRPNRFDWRETIWSIAPCFQQ